MIAEHGTRAEALGELKGHGYHQGFSSPGRPGLWINGKSRKATGVDSGGRWLIVDYPEPACCSPAVATELAVRDGVDGDDIKTGDWLE